jgi:hypothetical protein
VFHNQYNTPIGIYSDSNVFQEFQNQTKGIMPNLNTNSSKNIKGSNSLSMQMLNEVNKF